MLGDKRAVAVIENLQKEPGAVEKIVSLLQPVLDNLIKAGLTASYLFETMQYASAIVKMLEKDSSLQSFLNGLHTSSALIY